MAEHSVAIGFNPSLVTMRSDTSMSVNQDQMWSLSANSVTFEGRDLDSLRKELSDYAQDICKEVIETPLPHLHAINHVIPLIDDTMVYAWRPSQCSEALKPL